MIARHEARDLAIAAQGIGSPRGGAPAAVRRIAALQLDFVNVFTPAANLILYARLGPFRMGLPERTLYPAGEFLEAWAHEASIVPADLWPALAWRRARHRPRPWSCGPYLESNPGYLDEVLAAVRDRGPLTAAEAPLPSDGTRRIPGAWFGSIARAALEALFGCGRLAVVRRLPNFARVYDLAERAVPAPYRDVRLSLEDGQRELLRRAAAACGVATATDLADYFRIPLPQARPRIRELVEAGDIEPVRVEGWSEPAYLARGAKLKPATHATLLSPFDPIVWFRPRAQRLFDFEYRLEIYTPEPRRRWGYYVLPFLYSNRIAARVDLKADRPNRRLLVPGAWLEPGAPRDTPEALKAELHRAAAWLGLERVDRIRFRKPPPAR